VPVDRRVLAVQVVNATDPLAELGNWIDQGNHLMARLPLETKGITGHRVEHHLPSSRGVGDVPARPVPGASHIAILERDSYTFFLGHLGDTAEDLGELGDALVHWPIFERAGEAAHDLAIEVLHVADDRLPIAG